MDGDRMAGRNVVFPAPAGMNRTAQEAHALCRSVPRVSGDKPDALDAMMDITGGASIIKLIKTPSPAPSPEVALSA
ncbi:hypothetical protein [Escherichia sp. MOD1-EC7003]|uniref:hypothetical protein n=1 Tax=Escherichia sp. MOD1-EC7003 TaxID=2093900 RepID=UPI0012FFF855|nr:hypothetical protein [Escherichia sp. MOD1-EC7003]